MHRENLKHLRTQRENHKHHTMHRENLRHLRTQRENHKHHKEKTMTEANENIDIFQVGKILLFRC
jgi:hypothetical protein